MLQHRRKTAYGFSNQKCTAYSDVREPRGAAEAANSATGIVVEEDDRVWLTEFGARDLLVKGGQPIAIVGHCSYLVRSHTPQVFPTP
jgi:hypothetical protein